VPPADVAGMHRVPLDRAEVGWAAPLRAAPAARAYARSAATASRISAECPALDSSVPSAGAP